MHLTMLDTTQLTAHINAEQFNHGKNPIMISQQTLFLPESIKLIHYTPCSIIATVTDKDIA
jgi:hypothetical protein